MLGVAEQLDERLDAVQRGVQLGLGPLREQRRLHESAAAGVAGRDEGVRALARGADHEHGGADGILVEGLRLLAAGGVIDGGVLSQGLESALRRDVDRVALVVDPGARVRLAVPLVVDELAAGLLALAAAAQRRVRAFLGGQDLDAGAVVGVEGADLRPAVAALLVKEERAAGAAAGEGAGRALAVEIADEVDQDLGARVAVDVERPGLGGDVRLERPAVRGALLAHVVEREQGEGRAARGLGLVLGHVLGEAGGEVEALGERCGDAGGAAGRRGLRLALGLRNVALARLAAGGQDE